MGHEPGNCTFIEHDDWICKQILVKDGMLYGNGRFDATLTSQSQFHRHDPRNIEDVYLYAYAFLRYGDNQ